MSNGKYLRDGCWNNKLLVRPIGRSMIKTVHGNINGLVGITYICVNYSCRQYIIPVISWLVKVSIIKTDVKIIKSYFDLPV